MWGLPYPQSYFACFPADSGVIFPVCLPFSAVLIAFLPSVLSDFPMHAIPHCIPWPVFLISDMSLRRIVEQMEQAQGITEQLKADNALEWVGRMNNIQACAREIVDKEIIYQ